MDSYIGVPFQNKTLLYEFKFPGGFPILRWERAWTTLEEVFPNSTSHYGVASLTETLKYVSYHCWGIDQFFIILQKVDKNCIERIILSPEPNDFYVLSYGVKLIFLLTCN